MCVRVCVSDVERYQLIEVLSEAKPISEEQIKLPHLNGLAVERMEQKFTLQAGQIRS